MRARKAHSLIGQVYDRRNLRLAWERVKKNKGAGGVDGVTIARFQENLDCYRDVLLANATVPVANATTTAAASESQ